jgi:hypothetical protein
MKKWMVYTLVPLIWGCSQLREIIPKQKKYVLRETKYELYQEKDYLDQLGSLGKVYLTSTNINQVKLNNENLKYLNATYQRILKDNEIILDKNIVPQFFIIKDNTPFFFSLPAGQFFFSLGLFTKYLRHEELLVACLSYEMVKAHRRVYRKHLIVPVGHIDTEKMLYLTRIPLETRAEIDKWAFYVMKRAGHDALAYLNWLQMQNKNTLDFLLQFGEPQSISKEEFMFKNFIVAENTQFRNNNSRREVNSSAAFYQLLNDFKRVRME